LAVVIFRHLGVISYVRSIHVASLGQRDRDFF